MPIDPDQLARIRRFDRAAVEAMIVEIYPQLYRIACGLGGQEDVAAGTIRQLLRQSLDVMPKWKDEDAPQRYYLHHLLLLLRRTYRHQPLGDRDLLIGNHQQAADYVAYMQALRKLPFQQREAFILHHGERLNARYLAVAMDCSTSAAQNHLNSAETSLKTLVGDAYEQLTSTLTGIYRAICPPDAIAIPNVRMYLARQIRARRIRRMVQWFVAVLIVVGLGYLAAVVWPMIEY